MVFPFFGQMPTYSYLCSDCGHTYDAFQSMKDDPDTVCPSCQGRVDRLIGKGGGIVFKGSGFYVTDYKKSGSGSSSSGSDSSASPSGSSAQSSTNTSGSSGSSESASSSSTNSTNSTKSGSESKSSSSESKPAATT